MRPNDPMSFDLEAPGTTCIAFASSEHNGGARWTELSVFRLPDGKFLSQVQGKSSMPGERTKTQRLASASLERVLKLFADSDLGVAAAETAREWAEGASDAISLPDGYGGEHDAWTDDEVLFGLYGERKGRRGGEKGYSGLLAKDFGVSESTVRTAIANGTPIKVPLAAVFPFLDLAKLARAREVRDGR